jgi:hypothetical protein
VRVGELHGNIFDKIVLGRDSLIQDFTKELVQSFRPNLKLLLRQSFEDLRPEFKKALREDVRPELRRALEEDVRPHLKAAFQEDVLPQVLIYVLGAIVLTTVAFVFVVKYWHK